MRQRVGFRDGWTSWALPMILLPGAVLAVAPLGAPRAEWKSVGQPGPGVTVDSRRGSTGEVTVIRVDLSPGKARLEVAAADIARREGAVSGRALPLAGWLARTGACAAVNGGFFGRDVSQEHLQILGLLKFRGRVRSAAPRLRSRGGQAYARAALGIPTSGLPEVAWVTGLRPLLAYCDPLLNAAGRVWAVREAIGCGPALIRQGVTRVTDSEERLISPELEPRTVVATARGDQGEPIAALFAFERSGFDGCAQGVREYFEHRGRARVIDAICLDGGSSTQAIWKDRGGLASTNPFARSVPTAVVVKCGAAGE